MAETWIFGCRIDNNGDVNRGLDYLRNHWNDRYILDVFENARTSRDRKADFKINDIKGVYILKYVAEHHYDLSWKDYL
ncbi:MAG: hypothetical protein KA515_02815 [Candidatus Pacebacteria bacterium]|nr:hypothetical protein [Candidatus Paceibacterota bacterium]